MHSAAFLFGQNVPHPPALGGKAEQAQIYRKNPVCAFECEQTCGMIKKEMPEFYDTILNVMKNE